MKIETPWHTERELSTQERIKFVLIKIGDEPVLRIAKSDAMHMHMVFDEEKPDVIGGGMITRSGSEVAAEWGSKTLRLLLKGHDRPENREEEERLTVEIREAILAWQKTLANSPENR